jgi:flavin reductase (DIM6/NTAB) family NADH-FMN oxidoreductase RutF
MAAGAANVQMLRPRHSRIPETWMNLDPRVLTPGELYRFMISAIVPRPIAFVSSVDRSGRTNVAPFSYFAPLASRPPLLGISINDRAGGPKDTLRNLRATGDFVVNIVNEPMLKQMVRASGDWPPETSEFELTGLTPVTAERVRAPRVGESPIQFECGLEREVPLGSTTFVVGEILMVHVRDDLLVEGLVDATKLRAIGRLGGDAYTIVREVVREARPVVSPRPR